MRFHKRTDASQENTMDARSLPPSSLRPGGKRATQRGQESHADFHQTQPPSCKMKKSNYVRDSAQPLIFIRGTNDYFEVTEELAALKSIKGTTTGEDIYEKICQTVNDLELDWAKLASVTTDGAPSMVGSMKGVVARIKK
ncbi:hypothetical protein NDU88_000484 [Pleurodeles waltl]|uniref:DUF4371 domain-containing protein n=1 Tax=Pleurodeles waltl TaxID=8319 RepID=A0AAV7THC7_PLEWA|nr:hypothetical protein NDU88_000484 [Pleurodeles waltl]